MAEVACGLLKFDGVDDTVEFADDAAYDVSSAASYLVWYKRDYDDGESVLVQSGSRIEIKHTSHDTLTVTVSGVTPVEFTTSVERQVVHCIAVVIYEVGDDLVFELYKRGFLHERIVVSDAAMPAAAATTYNFGSSGGSSLFFKGRASQFIMTGDRLTASEVATIFALGPLVQDTSLFDNDVFAVPFDDGSGTSLDNDGVAGLDGSASGTPVWVTGYGGHLGSNPMIFKNEGDEYYGPVKVATIEWYKPTSAGHLVAVTDWAGHEIHNDSCAAANAGNGQKAIMEWIDGMKVVDLDSGWLIVRYM